MLPLQQLVRENVWALQPYTSARSEYTGKEGTFLDANENPFGRYSRYPDPQQEALKQKLSEIKQADSRNIFIGNGSDEVIDLAFRIFCRPGSDKALICTPTYGMYAVAAALNDVSLVQVPLDPDFDIDLQALLPQLDDPQLKLVLLCSPNNPTGNCLQGIETVLSRFRGIVVVDEAYIDFTPDRSLLKRLNRYPNLIVMQTLSKAWGLAAVRIGIAYASRDIIDLFHNIKPPYNVSTPNQQAALTVLANQALFEGQVSLICKQRAWLEAALKPLPLVQKVYPSGANFLLVAFTDPERVYKELLARQIIVRNRNNQVPGCLRITIGKPEENRDLVEALQTINNLIHPATDYEKNTLY